MAFPVPLDDELSGALTKDLPPPDYHVPLPTLSMWQRLLGHRQDKHLERVKYMLNGAAAGMGRQPTQQEVDALCEITYKEARTVAWILPTAFAFAGVLSWKSRATYKFPFYQPKFVKFNPDVFPSPRTPFVSGQYANIVWHNVRFVSYGVIAGIGVAPLLGSYATSVAIATAARDDRLGQFRKDMKPTRLISMTVDQMPLSSLRAQRNKVASGVLHAEQELQSKQNLLAWAKTEKVAAGYTSEIEYIRSRIKEYKIVLKQLDAAIARKSGQAVESDDTSQDQQAYAALSASGSADYQEPQSGSRPVYTTPNETSSPQNGWGQQSSTSQSGWGKADSSDGLDLDDASPIAPAARSAPQTSSPTGAGSAWDRLRQSSQRQQGPSGEAWEGPHGQQSQSGDSEASSEKDKAQRDFDEMLERERKTDDQGGGRNSRW